MEDADIEASETAESLCSALEGSSYDLIGKDHSFEKGQKDS